MCTDGFVTSSGTNRARLMPTDRRMDAKFLFTESTRLRWPPGSSGAASG
jgi:hypothetical protein